ncbi:MAG: glycosyltransferase, partial [Candidatus Hermodarchaeota archaeon]
YFNKPEMTKRLKSVLYMGSYEESYARNKIFIKGLQSNNIKVFQYNIKSTNLLKNLRLFLRNFKNLYYKNFDLIILFSQSPIQLLIAKFLAYLKRVPLIYDKFISKLQTVYHDRNLYKRTKLIPRIGWYLILYSLDFIDCKLADFIILDTYSHIKYFHEKFNIPLRKFRRILVGSQDDIFYPREKIKSEENKFIVGFWGSFIHLHGIEYIINAAKILEKDNEIFIILVGQGQTYEESEKLAKSLKLTNIKFIPKSFLIENKLEDLAELIATFDIGLGIFGNTDKTIQVIPNKIFEGIAMDLPMISCESPAIKELFTNEENIVLCERANSQSLANAILRLKSDKELRTKVRINANKIYHNYCSTEKISKNLMNYLNKILEKT